MFMDIREKYKVQILCICSPQQVTCAYNQKSHTENTHGKLALMSALSVFGLNCKKSGYKYVVKLHLLVFLPLY